MHVQLEYPRPEQDQASALSTSLWKSLPREQDAGRGSETTEKRKTVYLAPTVPTSAISALQCPHPSQQCASCVTYPLLLCRAKLYVCNPCRR